MRIEASWRNPGCFFSRRWFIFVDNQIEECGEHYKNINSIERIIRDKFMIAQ